MKKIYLLLVGFFIFTACEEDLELAPEQSISDQLAFSDVLTANGVLTGAYHLMQDAQVFGGEVHLYNEFMADNVDFSGSFPTFQQVNNFAIERINGSIGAVWREGYETIMAANSIIANAPSIEGASQEDIDKLVGEASFIRGAVYFQLVNMFAQPYSLNNGSSLGVPLHLTPFTGEVELLPRSTVAEVHNQIVTDLTAAQSLLSADVPQGRASSGAATALLARIRLYRGEWQQAADLANQVITSGDYALAADYSFYNTVNAEYIFTIENTALDGGTWDLYYEGNNEGGRGDGEFADNLIALFEEEAGDLRLELKETQNTFTGVPGIYTTKFNDGINDTSDGPIIRVSEMYLNRAEALAELNGINEESVGLVNDIRQRAGLAGWTTADFATDAEFIAAILVERRKELAFEGHRRLDLLRKGLPLRTADTQLRNPLNDAGVGLTAGDEEVIFPIPQRETDLNPNLEQNPGY